MFLLFTLSTSTDYSVLLWTLESKNNIVASRDLDLWVTHPELT